MIVVIDTNSLLALVRYYLPFDKDNILFDSIKKKVYAGEIITLDKVVEESKYVAKGVILKRLEFLKDKKHQFKTTDLLPTPKFFSQLENQFINATGRKNLTEVEFENRKNAFLNSADAKLILYAIKNKMEDFGNGVTIVSEETSTNNDNKSFKKIPAICNILEIDIITLPELIATYDDFKVNFNPPV